MMDGVLSFDSRAYWHKTTIGLFYSSDKTVVVKYIFTQSVEFGALEEVQTSSLSIITAIIDSSVHYCMTWIQD
jgi:hypothetical protein